MQVSRAVIFARALTRAFHGDPAIRDRIVEGVRLGGRSGAGVVAEAYLAAFAGDCAVASYLDDLSAKDILTAAEPLVEALERTAT